MAAAVGMQAGDVPARGPPGETAELLQYGTIIALRDGVVAGSHPRLKLPAVPSANVAVPKPVAPSAQLASAPSGLPNGHASPNRIPAASSVHLTAVPAPTENGTPTQSHKSNNVFRPSQHSPKLDPIFLKKSDSLIRAEIELQRQRIERGFEEEMQQKRAQSKRFSEQEPLPDFDVSDALQQAQELVPHLPPGVAPQANKNGSLSVSVEDGDYYSSQVNDASTDESGDRSKLRATKPCRYFFEGSCRKGDACSFSHDPAFKHQLQGLLDASGRAPEGDHNRNGRPQRGRPSNGGRLRPSPTYSNRESGELIEDSPYSPSLQVPVEDTRPEQATAHEPQTRDRFNSRPDPSHDNRGRRPSPDRGLRARASPDIRDGRIVRNHITSPVAPQPSRVSPLAVARLPRVQRLRQDGNDDRSPRRSQRIANCNNSPASQPSARKRRREAEVDDLTRNVAPRRHLDSPGPQIKEEPISPPPLNDISSYQAGPQDNVIRVPVGYRAASRQTDRVVYQPLYPEHDGLPRADARRITPPPTRRVVSGSELAHEPVNGAGGRRVVSARYPERVASPSVRSIRDERPLPQTTFQPMPTERSYAEGRDITATSHVSAQPQHVLYPYPREPTSPAIQRIQCPPMERQGSVMSMTPPKRIVMDQDGNRYYEVAYAEPRAPPVRGAYYNDPAPNPRYAPIQRVASVRPPTARVASDSHYVQRAASPQPVRYVEYRGSAAPMGPPQPPPRFREASPAPYRDSRGQIVQLVEYPPPDRREARVRDYAERQPEIIRVGSAAPRGDQFESQRSRPVMRMQSIQPRDGPAYEAPRPGIAHHAQSVQPEPQPPRVVELDRASVAPYPRAVREVSIRPQERFVPSEFVEQPRYQYVVDGRAGGYEVRRMDG